MMKIKLTINNEEFHVPATPGEKLLSVLRRLGFYGVKHGCETGECGVCTVPFGW